MNKERWLLLFSIVTLTLVVITSCGVRASEGVQIERVYGQPVECYVARENGVAIGFSCVR